LFFSKGENQKMMENVHELCYNIFYHPKYRSGGQKNNAARITSCFDGKFYG